MTIEPINFILNENELNAINTVINILDDIRNSIEGVERYKEIIEDETQGCPCDIDSVIEDLEAFYGYFK